MLLYADCLICWWWTRIWTSGTQTPSVCLGPDFFPDSDCRSVFIHVDWKIRSSSTVRPKVNTPQQLHTASDSSFPPSNLHSRKKRPTFAVAGSLWVQRPHTAATAGSLWHPPSQTKLVFADLPVFCTCCTKPHTEKGQGCWKRSAWFLSSCHVTTAGLRGNR